MGFAYCPRCAIRLGTMIKVGTKYLHFRCRKCHETWKETIGSPEYEAQNYRLYDYVSEAEKVKINAKKLATNFGRHHFITFDVDWNDVLSKYEDYNDAVVKLKKMSADKRAKELEKSKIGN